MDVFSSRSDQGGASLEVHAEGGAGEQRMAWVGARPIGGRVDPSGANARVHMFLVTVGGAVVLRERPRPRLRRVAGQLRP